MKADLPLCDSLPGRGDGSSLAGPGASRAPGKGSQSPLPISELWALRSHAWEAAPRVSPGTPLLPWTRISFCAGSNGCGCSPAHARAADGCAASDLENGPRLPVKGSTGRTGLATIGRSDTAVRNPRAGWDPRDCPLTPGGKASRSHQPGRCCCQDNKPESSPPGGYLPDLTPLCRVGGLVTEQRLLPGFQRFKKTLTMAEAKILAGGQDPAPA